MPSPYQIAIVHCDQHDFAAAIASEVTGAVSKVLGRDDLLNVVEELPDTALASHVVVVYAGSPAGANDPSVRQDVQRALERGFPVLPVVHAEAGSVADSLPPAITHLNAVDWRADRSLALGTIMQLLGLQEDERRLFLSYVRRDSAAVAEQLHRALQERRFDVFLDRFSVPPAADFQRWLTEDLADKAFMLLLESDGIRDSRWVQHEVNYALSHRIGVLAATMPGVDKTRIAAVDEAFRFRLPPGALDPGGRLRGDTLDQLLERIEVAHARALRRRREQVLGSLTDHLESAGCSWEPLGDWAIMASARHRLPSAFLVTPRGPRPEDLRALDVLSEQAKLARGTSKLAGSLVHDVADIDEKRAELLGWIGAPRGLAVRRVGEVQLEAAA